MLGPASGIPRRSSKCRQNNLVNVSDAARRHLVRLWLRDPEHAWETPEFLQDRWDHVYKDVTPEASVFPLEPFIRNGDGRRGRASERAAQLLNK